MSNTSNFLLFFSFTTIRFNGNIFSNFSNLILIGKLSIRNGSLTKVRVGRVLRGLITRIEDHGVRRTSHPRSTTRLGNATILGYRYDENGNVLCKRATKRGIFPIRIRLINSVRIRRPVRRPRALHAIRQLYRGTRPIGIIRRIILSILRPEFSLHRTITLSTMNRGLHFHRTIITLKGLLPRRLTMLNSRVVGTVLLMQSTSKLLRIYQVNNNVRRERFGISETIRGIRGETPFLGSNNLILLLHRLVISVLVLSNTNMMTKASATNAILGRPLRQSTFLYHIKRYKLKQLFTIFVLFRGQGR